MAEVQAKMRIDVLTLFPEIVSVPLGVSIVGRAQKNNIVQIAAHDIRQFSHDKHGKVDDRPYGGGPGMVLKPEPIFEAVEFVKREAAEEYSNCRVILMTPQGEIFSHGKAGELSAERHLLIICGRYEGIDERVRQLVTDELSIGDYVISGGEMAAMVVIEAVVRLLPGALGDENSAKEDSFFSCFLDYPQYTRPSEYRGMKVPSVLCSGDHEKIRRWRRMQALKRTSERRPDIFEKLELTEEDRELLEVC